MPRPAYDPIKENEVVGTYPPIEAIKWPTAPNGLPESPKLYRPITPLENYKLLFAGKTPYWIPESGWTYCDVVEFRPRQIPDNMANHQAFDGGGKIEWEKFGKVINGWFDLPYEWEENSGGATVRPGNPKLETMEDWQDYITFPDLDAIDWDAIGEMNQVYLSTDKVNQLGIQFGMWERMMNLMDVDNAAVALIDDDQEEDLCRWLDTLAAFYIDYIDRMTKVCRIDSIMIHDDWGTQNGPFFSIDTCRHFFVPRMKKVIDFAHSKGIVWERHCCGKAQDLVPCMVEEGDDYWSPQPALNDLDMLIETYKDEHITFCVGNPTLTKDMTEEDIRQLAYDWVQKYKDAGILLIKNIAFDFNADPSKYPIFRDAVYEFSRIAYQDAPAIDEM